MSNSKGAASAAPKLPRRRGKSKRAIKRSTALSYRPEVVSWIRRKTNLGWDRPRMIQASADGTDDWPVPGKKLSDGAISEALAAIVAEDRIKAESLTSRAAIRARQRTARTERVDRAQRKSRLQKLVTEIGGRSAAVTACQKVSNQCMALIMTLHEFDFDELDVLDRKLRAQLTGDVLDDFAEAVGMLQSRLGHFEARTEDKKVREVIAKLRAKAASTEFPHEATAFNEAADQLEFKLNNKLEAA